MRETLDTFLHFLADNLGGIAVHALRRDPNDSASSVLQMNAVNVKVVNAAYDWHISLLQVSIDVLNDDELTAIDWTKQVWTLLGSSFTTPKYDYSPVATGGQPTALKSNVFWKTSAKFRPVKNDFYTHFTATLSLHHSN